MASENIDEIVDMAKIDAQLSKVVALIDVVIARINTLNKSGINLKFTAPGGGSGSDGLKAASTDADKLAAALKRLELAESQLGADIATVNERIRQQNVLNAQAARQNIAQAGSLNELRARLAAATTAFDNMSAAQRKSASGGQATIKVIKQLQQEVRELEQETGRFQRNVGNYPKLVGQGASSILGAFGIATGAAAIGATAKAVFDTTVKIDSLNAAIRAVSGSEEEFAKNQAYLVDLSQRLGLNVLSMTQAYKLFYASSTQAGLSADATREIFTSVAEASSTLKLSQEDTSGVLLAFSQILGKGKVQAEELRGQIGERLPGAFAIAARSIGKTEQELNKMLQQGQVISADFLPKFAAELKKTFGNGGQEAEGLQAAINRLSNAFTKLVSDNESGLSRFFTLIVDGSQAALEGLSSIIKKLAESPKTFKVFNADGSEYLTQAEQAKKALEDIKGLKNANDALIKDFGTKDAAQQAKLFAQYTAIYQASKANREKAIADFGANSKEALEANKRLIQDANLIERLSEKIQGNRAAPPAAATDAQLKKASRLRELQDKAMLEGLKITKQEAIDSQKLIYDNEKFTYDQRLVALDTYVRLKNELIDESAEHEKDITKENIQQGQAVAEQLVNIDKQAAVDKGKVALEAQEKLKEIAKNVDDERIRQLMATSEKEKIVLDDQATDTLEQLKNLHDQEKISDEDYEIAKAQTQNKYEQLRLERELDTVEKIIAIRKLEGQNVEEEENKAAAIRSKIRALDVEDYGKNAKKKKDLSVKEAQDELKARKELNDKLKDLARELADFAFTVINAGFEREKQQIDDQLELRKKATQDEIDAINRSTASAQDKADKIAVVNARAAADEERLNERKKQIEIQQARFEKARSIAQVITSTAAAVVKTFATFPFYLAAPIAAIIAGIGAAQLATIVATPLPKYKEGREDGPAEAAIVGDGGIPEVVQVGDMAYLTPSKDTVTWLPKGAKVHKSVEAYKKSMGEAAISPLPSLAVNKGGHLVQNNNADIVRAIEKNKTIVNVRATWEGLKTTAESAAGKIDYLNKNVYH